MIPAPVLAELLVKRDIAQQTIINKLRRSNRFEISAFGEPAAIEAADIFRRNWPKRQGLKILSKSKFKFDMQIIAISKASRADTIYSTDGGLIALAGRENLRVLTFDQLVDPPAYTPSFFPSISDATRTTPS